MQMSFGVADGSILTKFFFGDLTFQLREIPVKSAIHFLAVKMSSEFLLASL